MPYSGDTPDWLRSRVPLSGVYPAIVQVKLAAGASQTFGPSSPSAPLWLGACVIDIPGNAGGLLAIQDTNNIDMLDFYASYAHVVYFDFGGIFLPPGDTIQVHNYGALMTLDISINVAAYLLQ